MIVEEDPAGLITEIGSKNTWGTKLRAALKRRGMKCSGPKRYVGDILLV